MIVYPLVELNRFIRTDVGIFCVRVEVTTTTIGEYFLLCFIEAIQQFDLLNCLAVVLFVSDGVSHQVQICEQMASSKLLDFCEVVNPIASQPQLLVQGERF